MFVFLSKFLPLFVYPLGLTCVLLVIALLVRTGSRWLKILVGAALALLWLGGSDYVSTSLVRSLEWQHLPSENLPEAEMIVVLGGGTGSAQYPREIVELSGAADRMFYASWLYHQGVAPRLLLTGGNIPWLGVQETKSAENMAFVMQMLGVPEQVLLLETASLNTFENAVFSKAILDQEGVSRIVLVTSAMHMPRSVKIFEAQGFDVIPAPTDFAVSQAGWDRLWKPDLVTQIFHVLPNVDNLSATTLALKEYLGMLVYSLRGWL
jgi:uncharacterized SAM-binding protein YcdF (DUF218 family)